MNSNPESWTVQGVRAYIAAIRLCGVEPLYWRVSPEFLRWWESQGTRIAHVAPDDMIRTRSARTIGGLPTVCVLKDGFQLITEPIPHSVGARFEQLPDNCMAL